MTKYTAFPLLQRLEATLTMNPPYCSGILEVPYDAFKLYYGGKEARFIDLLEASTSNDHNAIEALANACERAKFGRGEETVLDETYRKAGKMDAENFMTGLDLEGTGLRDAVRLGLLSQGEKDKTRTVRAELYKLNVYGEGAFFKPHKDTPRSQSMFGSLVVIFPTPHEGGALVLRHEDEEFTFDAAALLAGRTSSIAYVAFFSDVEHEVTPVVSGHRVTLTYNLYYGARRSTISPDSLEVLQPLHASAPAVKDALASLLDNATFMPHGGMLGFGLRHRYPLPKVWTCGMDSPLKSLKAWLKGSDAALFAACAELGDLEDEIMLDRMLALGEYVEHAESELRRRGGVLLNSLTFTGDAEAPWASVVDSTCEEYGDGDLESKGVAWGLAVHWLTEGGYKDGPRSAYMAYGNEASLDWLYTRVCLLVKIGRYGNRSGESDA